MKYKIYYLVITLLLLAVAIVACGSSTSNVVVNAPQNTNAAAVTVEPAGTPASASGESQAAAAAAVVADLYKANDAKKGPFFQTKNRALVDKYFTKPLADLIWKDATTSKGEVGVLDGDPLYNAQDMQIKNFSIGTADVKGDTATVPVNFTNFGDKQQLTFVLKQAGGTWKIDDIKYNATDSLRGWFSTAGSNTPADDGTFEGKYQVGDTTCTVTPVKMAYEVKWAKGSGSELFFSKEGSTFESDPKAGRPNQFVFDDEFFNTGSFNRADGKSFPIKRIK
jgi:hypothetical protein